MKQLKNKRSALARKESLPDYRICNNTTLDELEKYLPQNMMEMSGIKGMGHHTLNKYGEAFLQIVISYCKQYNLEGRMQEKKSVIQKKKKEQIQKHDTPTDTKTQSFLLYKAGQTIAQIAADRNLSPGTIEVHLSPFIADGRIDIFSLLSKEKYEQILVVLQSLVKDNVISFTTAKKELGDTASFAEMRWVWSHWQVKQNALN